jgi:hypothetical protein
VLGEKGIVAVAQHLLEQMAAIDGDLQVLAVVEQRLHRILQRG